MMSENRQSRIAERRNELDLQINLLAEQESTETLRLLRMLCEKLGVDMKPNPTSRALEKQTLPEEIFHQIEQLDPGDCR